MKDESNKIEALKEKRESERRKETKRRQRVEERPRDKGGGGMIHEGG